MVCGVKRKRKICFQGMLYQNYLKATGYLV